MLQRATLRIAALIASAIAVGSVPVTAECVTGLTGLTPYSIDCSSDATTAAPTSPIPIPASVSVRPCRTTSVTT